MLTKLALRNARRSSKDYFIYLITMMAISAMMFAFNSIIFSKDVWELFSVAGIMAALLGLISFFIILIVAWLINYMAKFMLERRSKEFGTYLLIGMKRKDISHLYIKENLFIGTIALIGGLVLGGFLQQIIMTIFYSIFSMEYKLKLEIKLGTILMTLGCYYACYFLALLNNKKVLKKLSIAELMKVEKENESITENHEGAKQLLFFISIAYMIFAYFMIYKSSSTLMIFLLITGFVISIYMMFSGISAFIIKRVKNRGSWIYKHNRLFVLRQFSAKAKSMRFVMGTLTVLMVFSILSTNISMMFSKCQTTVGNYTMPFDVLIYGSVPDDDFSKEISTLENTCGINDKLLYNIYTDGNNTMNSFYRAHVPILESETEDYKQFYSSDTYIRLSDYNKLRKMLGYDEISLNENEYAVQTKKRLLKYIQSDLQDIKCDSLVLNNIYTDAFSQNGLNGADYLIVVNDNLTESMKPFFSLMAIDTTNKVDKETYEKVKNIYKIKNNLAIVDEFDDSDVAENGTQALSESKIPAVGSDQLLVFNDDLFIRDVDIPEMKFIMASIIFPLAYIGLIFIFVAMTVLSVQQFSDSSKSKFRYVILSKIGYTQKEIRKTVLHQFVLYYILPAISAIAMSIVACIYIGNAFVKYTGIDGNGLYYFLISFAIFMSVYLLYFITTYVGFIKNINNTEE